MKRVLTFALSFALILGCLTACGNSSSDTPATQDTASGSSVDEKIVVNMHVGSFTPDSPSDWLTQALEANLEEAFEGRLEFNLLTPGSIGSEKESVQALMMGDIDMTCAGDASYDIVLGNLSFAFLPYLFEDYEDVEEYYWNGWIGEEIEARLAEAGMVKVGNFDSGFRMLSSNKGEVHSMDDIDGLKVRVPELDYYSKFYEYCGMLPVAMSPSEAMTAIEQGTVDGCDNAWTGFTGTGTIEVTPNICATNYTYGGASISVNADWFAKLSTGDQELFKNVCTETGKEVSLRYRESIETEMKEKEAAGEIIVTYPDEAFKADLKEVGMKVWDYMSGKIDSDLMDRIYADFGNQ